MRKTFTPHPECPDHSPRFRFGEAGNVRDEWYIMRSAKAKCLERPSVGEVNKLVGAGFIFLTIVLLLSGCLLKNEVLMDKPADDGNYHYQNKDLGFSLVLPAGFQYYQTQRKKTDEYIEIEFFVPTSDLDYPQEVVGYGKPLAVRIFNKETWQSVSPEDKSSYYIEVGENDEEKIYTLKFWKSLPKDWADK